MDFTLRCMRESDFGAVAEIEAGVFTDWYRMYRREQEPLGERTQEQMRYSTSLDPEGNHVAVAADGALVGFLFSRTWGSVGWFGTFGVPTQFHGLGIGSALVERAVEHLSVRASVIGLETMPESGPNIGLYTKAGFAVTYPTLILELSLIHEAGRFSGARMEDSNVWSDLGRSERARALVETREVSGALTRGLDFSGEVEAVSEYGIGRTLLSRGKGGRLEGFAILRTVPFRCGDNSGRAYIHALCIRPEADQGAVLRDLLGQIWATATALGLSKAAVGLNARYHRALGLMREAGFGIVRAGIRMVHLPVSGEIFKPTDMVEMSRWAG